MTEKLLEIKDLTKRFGDFTALDSLNLDVTSHRIFGLLGLNGAGKSTTMRCILTLIRPTSGTILYKGKNLLQNRNNILGHIGAMVEKADHYLNLTAFENLVMHTKLYGISPEKKYLGELLDLVGLSAQSHKTVKTFSQGMKQRLGIASTLVHRPELIILDEPSNGLDPQGIIDLRNLILRLKNDMHKTIIVSSHLLNEIEQVADDFAIIHRGKTVTQGTVADMVSKNDMMVMIGSEHNEQLLQVLRETAFSSRVHGIVQDCLQLKIHHQEIPHIINIAVDHHINIFHIQSKNRLEACFFELTQHE